jgi:hypothetical protein
MNEGWANCSTLFCIDTHELPFGSTPPVAPALAISSAGLAPNAAEENKLTIAMPTIALTVRSVRRRWRLDQKRCDRMVELTRIFSLRTRRSTRIIFDVFNFAGDIFSR